MTLAIDAERPPIKADASGVFRVGGTRVTLDTVVGAYNAGAAPEEIALRYDSLRLEDVYLVIGYYLRHRAEVDAHLIVRKGRGADRQAESDARLPWSEVRQRLMSRQESADSAPGSR